MDQPTEKGGSRGEQKWTGLLGESRDRGDTEAASRVKKQGICVSLVSKELIRNTLLVEEQTQKGEKRPEGGTC